MLCCSSHTLKRDDLALRRLRFRRTLTRQGILQEAAHFVRRGLLHLSGHMGVGVQRKTCAVVSQHTGHRFHIHAVEQGGCGERMPLCHNKDLYGTCPPLSADSLSCPLPIAAQRVSSVLTGLHPIGSGRLKGKNKGKRERPQAPHSSRLWQDRRLCMGIEKAAFSMQKRRPIQSGDM